MKILGGILMSLPCLAFLGMIVWCTIEEPVITWITIGGCAAAIACAWGGGKLLNR